MSNLVKYVLIPLMVILFGVVVFLGYKYFTEFQKPKSSTSLPSNVTLSGQVLRGQDTTASGASCPDQYYLVSGNKAVWLTKTKGDEVENSRTFSPYAYSKVEAKGSDNTGLCYTTAERNCGCTNYLAVGSIKALSAAVLPDEGTEYNGKIVCLNDVNGTPLEGCVEGLQTEDGYQYYLNYLVNVDKSGITGNAVGANPDLIGAKVKILGTDGVLGDPKIGASGAIDVFEISNTE